MQYHALACAQVETVGTKSFTAEPWLKEHTKKEIVQDNQHCSLEVTLKPKKEGTKVSFRIRH